MEGWLWSVELGGPLAPSPLRPFWWAVSMSILSRDAPASRKPITCSGFFEVYEGTTWVGCLFPGGQHAVLLAVRMEGGAVSQGSGVSRSWKRQDPVVPRASRETSPTHSCILAQCNPCGTPDLQNCEMTNVCGFFWLYLASFGRS